MSDASHAPWRIAGARGGAYALMGAAFRYPTSIPFHALTVPAFWEQTLSPLENGDSEWSEARAALHEGIERLGGDGASLTDAQTELEDEYSSLFGHAVRGACPPYELEYGPGEIVQRAPDLADIAGFYAAFGLEMAPDSDRPDHIMAECEFMSALCFKEAAAGEADSMEHVEQCQAAQRAFLRDHLSFWLPAFSRRLGELARPGFYADVAKFARVFIEEECHRFHLPLGPVWLELRPADPERDTSIECGPEDSCVPGGSQPLVQLTVPSA